VRQLVTGKTLTLKDNKNPGRQLLSAVSKDPTITLGGGNGSADDPIAHGGSLRIRSNAGGGFDHTFPLPASGWRLIGKPGQNRGYKFTSTTGVISTRALLKPGKLLKAGSRGALGDPLATNPAPVELVLRTGNRTYCMRFGGTPKFKAGKLFTAKGAPAPSSCPP